MHNYELLKIIAEQGPFNLCRPNSGVGARASESINRVMQRRAMQLAMAASA